MIVRESPKAKQSSDRSFNWPPKSPHEALLSSPSGRKKLEQRRCEDHSPSPSPMKRPFSGGAMPAADTGIGSGADEDDDSDDEEILRLQIQAMEARLKLKKLQKAKAKLAANSPRSKIENLQASPKVAAFPGTSSHPNLSRAPDSPRREQHVQVLASPVKRQEQPSPESPRRITLGIDKGLRAQDVSLKRPASSRPGKLADPFKSQPSRSAALFQATSESFKDRPLTFSERIAASRAAEKEKAEKEERINNARSRGFGLNESQKTISSHAHAASGKASPPPCKPQSQSSKSEFLSLLKSSATSRPTKPNKSKAKSSSDEATIEPYSGVFLSKRAIIHTDLTRALHNKEIYPIPRLLQDVKGPHYTPPDVESDFVIVGIIASKSEPRSHRKVSNMVSNADSDDESTKNNKFMILRLTDLKWEMDLFLFDTGFKKYWKLTPGTVVAILNPGIMPPRDKNTGIFGLKLSSSEDTILEIGSARDLNWCSAKKKDGEECGAWVDKRKMSVCEYHIALEVDKAKKGRMEVNTMSGYRGGGRGARGGFRGARGGGGGRGGFGFTKGDFRDDGLKREGKYHDKYLHETMYITPGVGGSRSSASLLDNDDMDMFEGMSKKELMKKRKSEQEKERELGKKLGEIGNGLGAEYARIRNRTSTHTATASPPIPDEWKVPEPPDAAALGLLANKAQDVKLTAPAGSRKRGHAAMSSGTPVGWSSAFKSGLPGVKKPDLSATTGGDAEALSPNKRTRFMLDMKGLREPGRESTGPLIKQEEDDDDGLDII
ncbi:hypothetical protein K402DRAFT_465775 [Aulographum hederae CBS 113979]|uniref:Uncharacterized protein n=1 Tax=Aulographum hederae CBS 113979 TaxID=1176131 RepID=A0A6G1GRR6_9PEZI|nr:hypothetical protein K402DRAFT_465775 [Aulographum hederae CBS 113979]